MNKTKWWALCRKNLKEIYYDKGITTCELRFKGCWINNALGFAHKKKRKEYLCDPASLGDFNETILACNHCHNIIEDNKELTEEVFKRLRPNL